MESYTVDILGWIGSLMLIAAYWMVSQKKITPESYNYHGLNICGSVLLILNTCYYGAFPSAAVNIIWVIIGLFFLTKNRNFEA